MYVSRPVLRFEARPKTCVHESTVLRVQLCWQFIGDRSFAHISEMLLWFSLASSAPVYSLVRFVPKGVQKRLTINEDGILGHTLCRFQQNTRQIFSHTESRFALCACVNDISGLF